MRLICAILLLLAGFLFASAASGGDQETARPNLLVIGASSLNSPIGQPQLLRAMLDSKGMPMQGLPATLRITANANGGDKVDFGIEPNDAKYLQEAAWRVYQREIKNTKPANTSHGGSPKFSKGKGETTIHVGSYALKVFTYRPKNYSAKQSPLILVFHGHSRNADSYRDSAISIADECGGVVVAPLFDEKQFPGNSYNHGNVMPGGKVQPKEKWTFTLIPKLIEEIRAVEGRGEMPYYLLGHSGGGQFVERLIAFADLKPIRAVAANPGSHLFPTKELRFPYGFGELPEAISGDTALKAYLAAPLTIYLGTADTDPNHPLLDKKAEAEKQGPHRLARGRACFETAKKLAADKGWEFGWRLVEAPDIGHAAGKMFAHPKFREALFGKPGGGKAQP
jgi:poly(3-hydroxybutyrate) depolymerase